MNKVMKALQIIQNNITYLLSDCDVNDEVEQCLEDIRVNLPTIEQYIIESQEQNKKYNEINKTFSDSHICEIKKEFSKYTPLCEESKCDECPLGVGDGICLKNAFEKKWELQSKL